MIDLHTHSFLSDGELIPAELIQRAERLGYRALAITDHVDNSNLDFIAPRLVAAVAELNRHHQVQTIAGVELTHLPPAMIAPAAARAREMGAGLVVVHGQSPVEPVAEGTNRAAIEAGVDILAHPGLITPEEVALAADKGVALEISARGGHSLGNGRVASLAREAGATVVINTDAHAPRDLVSRDFARTVGLAAGLSDQEVEAAFAASAALASRVLGVRL
jgi:histidinol phosphatase-like PHP family hydrolase